MDQSIDYLSQFYTIETELGVGTYGVVYKAVNNANGDEVAIKEVPWVFQDLADAIRLLREISILRNLAHPNIIPIKNIHGPTEHNMIFIVMPAFQADLNKLIRSPVYLDNAQIAYILYQMVTGVRYMHSASILHRDLKPANILVNEDASITICDFGLARSHYIDEFSELTAAMSQGEDEEKKESNTAIDARVVEGSVERRDRRKLTAHVVTRWYRPPELILVEKTYDHTVDIWSLGCIFAEVFAMNKNNVAAHTDRKPIFPGKFCFPLSPNQRTAQTDSRFMHDQIWFIIDMIGTPEEDDIAFLTDENAKRYIQSFEYKEHKNFCTLFPDTPPEGVDLLTRMLQFNPQKRISLDEVIKHPYFKQFRNPKLEIQASEPPRYPWEFDVDITLDHVKELLMEELNYFTNN